MAFCTHKQPHHSTYCRYRGTCFATSTLVSQLLNRRQHLSSVQPLSEPAGLTNRSSGRLNMKDSPWLLSPKIRIKAFTETVCFTTLGCLADCLYAVLCTLGFIPTARPISDYKVRFAFLIPSHRVAHAHCQVALRRRTRFRRRIALTTPF